MGTPRGGTIADGSATASARMPQPEYESYVVRIYRRDRKNRSRLSGVIEVVAKGTIHRFTGTGELLAIMQAQPRFSRLPEASRARGRQGRARPGKAPK